MNTNRLAFKRVSESTRNVKLAVNEIFASVQGEGMWAGVPSIFVRLSGCNLRCCFRNPEGGITTCDTPYASFKPEALRYKTIGETLDALAEYMVEYPKIEHIVFTGGEPLLQQESLALLIEELDKYTSEESVLFTYTVETNGTIVPSQDMLNNISLWNVSPKLEGSCAFDEGCGVSEALQEQHKRLRINPEALGSIAYNSQLCQFKFVWTGPECEAEIDSVIEAVSSNREFSRQNAQELMCITIMPQGIRPEEISANADQIVETCMRRGWRYSDRLQIRLWGNKRGV